MMASIRLFGRGKSAAGAGSGTAVSAEQIAQLLAGLETASMSTTWRCRHGSGTAIGEGAVDFETRRSRATVIRGKYAFEYVRVGSSVYRAPILDDEVQAQLGGGKTATAAKAGSAAPVVSAVDDEVEDEEDEGFEEDAELEEDTELEAGAQLDDEDELDDDAELEAEADEADLLGEAEGDLDGVDDPDAAAEDDESLDAQDEKDEDGPQRDWQTFSENDACGVHAYAEPAVLAAGVRAAGAVTAAGRQEFDGKVLTGYTVTLKPKPADPDRLLARLARQLRDHGANTLVLTAFVDESERVSEAVPDFSGTAGEEAAEGGPQILRLRLELPHWTPADDPTADHAVTVDLFEFGDPVEVQAPSGGTTRRTMRSCADLALF
ncbi:MAG TPA: hypothetical protein VFA06_24655 [Actinocrinis sp.]|uniref:hypothetical protein n=1 Tax=Actinocrinis sp. TaxID=1920516 RepID=UPI002D37A0F5|nr:hypothetical protein [Actinocrinis sp.]HZU59094.1 hypothetical protein [Actinocrinis sp.]